MNTVMKKKKYVKPEIHQVSFSKDNFYIVQQLYEEGDLSRKDYQRIRQEVYSEQEG